MTQINNKEILWSGMPKQGIIATSRDLYMVPFSILWCGFAVFWTISATSHGAPIFFTIWGSMFICFGIYIVFGRFLHDSIRRSHIIYSVTSCEIIINNGNEIVIPLGQWSCINMKKFKDGTGTIKFGESKKSFGSNIGFLIPSFSDVPQFYRISDPQKVLDLLTISKRQIN